ncbi:MAG: hypothetical protein ACRYGF_05560 [Janthinobacterium lividum]
MSKLLFSAAVLSAAIFAAASTPASAQDEGPTTLRVVVRAEAKHDAVPPVLKASDLQVEFDGKKTNITHLDPLSRPNGTPVEVALLIDDGLRGNFGTQLRDVEQFVQATAGPQVSLGVGYMRNGRAEFPAGFSTDPEREVGAIRLPISSAGISGSPYFCLQDLVKHWPTNTNAAHVVLMITNGIDYYNGSVSPLNQDSPYVATAVTDAQRAGVPVYSIYYGRRELSANLPSFSGQSYLSQVAEGTGGKLFNGGQINPPSLTPYFKEFNTALRESYLVSFVTGSHKLERLKISTSVDGVKVHAQQAAGGERTR